MVTETPPGTCPICGARVFYKGRGRRPIYCSTRCKNRAANAAAATRDGAPVVEVRTVVREVTKVTKRVPKTPPPPPIPERLRGAILCDTPEDKQLVLGLLNTPEATKVLLSALVHEAHAQGPVATDPEWRGVRNIARWLVDEIGPDKEVTP